MESCKCPITQELFEDPVMGDDGHTYERKAITDWLTKIGTSPITQQPMDINSLRTNYMAKKMVEERKSMPQSMHTQYQFELDIHIRKRGRKPLFQTFGKSIYDVEWIDRDGPPIILLKIDGAKANREASFYVQLSCHPHIVRTFGLVQSNPGSVMLLQELASQGDLSELLRENGFKPIERVLCTIFEQICDAMICLADNNIVHGDLACRNTLVFQSDPTEPRRNLVKLTDFGLTRASSLYSVVDSPTRTTMTIIPLRYAAPELFRDMSRLKYSEKSDVYSMGTLMWEACSYGELPYSLLEDEDDVEQKKLDDERLSRPSLCGDQLWTIINECWHQNPEERPNFQSLKQSLLNLSFEVEFKMKLQLEMKTNSSVPDANVRAITANSLRPLRRNSYDRFPEENDDASGSTYACDCGHEHMNEEALKRHQQTNSKNRSIPCPFCQETFSSSAALRDHLLLCGNKTDQCPNCRQLIRRSHFAYHYENNCAPVDQVETPPSRPKSRSNQRLPANFNTPVSREDVPPDNYAENYSGQNPSMYPPRVNGRIQSPVSNLRNSPGITECEFCHNQCAQNDYKTHRDSCLQNPANINYAPPQRIPPKRNQNISNGVVHIPCDICHQPVDLPNWSNHIQNCREREKQRLAQRARSMSQEPVTEQLPCEYCQQLFPPKRLHSHQTSCPQNPANMNAVARLPRTRPPASFSLPTRSNDNRNRPPLSNVGISNNRSNVHYQSIDIDQTHAANRSPNNDKLINRRSPNPYPMRRAASDEVLLQREDSFRVIKTYGNEPMRSSEHRSQKNSSPPFKKRPANDSSPQERSSLDNLRNMEDNQDPSGRAVNNRSPYKNNPRYQYRGHHGDENVEVIDNQHGRAYVKKHKVPWWKELFECASKSDRNED